MIHTTQTFLPLTSAERLQLLGHARRSIAAALGGAPHPDCTSLTPALSELGAAFVSLHCERRLRGCIGTLAADRPLYRTVAQMAVSAAFDDPRFPPLATEELPEVEIEISRLSALVPAHPEDIDPARHGVSLIIGDQRAVFLPQVARQCGWDRDTLLNELCRKALLPPESWHHPTTILMIFEAEIFADNQ